MHNLLWPSKIEDKSTRLVCKVAQYHRFRRKGRLNNRIRDIPKPRLCLYRSGKTVCHMVNSREHILPIRSTPNTFRLGHISKFDPNNPISSNPFHFGNRRPNQNNHSHHHNNSGNSLNTLNHQNLLFLLQTS